MDVPLEIAYHNVEKSDALEEKIRDRVARMHRHFNHINSCRVVVEVPHRSQVNALEYHLRIEIRVPEKELIVSRDPGDRKDHYDPYLLVRDAFDAAERQLEQYSQRIREDVKRHAAPLQGKVLRMFHDHGFIGTNDGREVYFHRNAVVDTDFEAIEPETPVELSLIEGESPIGPQASTVRPIRPMEYVPERTGRA